MPTTSVEDTVREVAAWVTPRQSYWVTVAVVQFVCRIKKLIDMEALSFSRLKLVVLDMQKDAKSFTLFTLPQVSNEFWDLYKGYLDPKIREGNMKICFYGAVSERDITKTFSLAE
ncbi:hypothetical protein Zm00014a_010172 [Zea mays]|uniref:Uncharacterized protein n=1 Tax=Zea mays TaxID=4577 RepID=A0A3L6FUQ9_MAIZE|nr:hypothetical protein Zm00014a_010172 [Zea mays]